MHDPALRDSGFLLFRIFCGVGLAATLAAGGHLWKNFDRLLGTSAGIPSGTRGARGYNPTLVVAVWLHFPVFFTMGVLLLH